MKERIVRKSIVDSMESGMIAIVNSLLFPMHVNLRDTVDVIWIWRVINTKYKITDTCKHVTFSQKGPVVPLMEKRWL